MDNRKKLRFNESGKFRILMISDLHCRNAMKEGSGLPFNPKLKIGIEALVNETQPDFVMLGGDQCVGYGERYMKDVLEDVLEPVQKRGIPWAHVNGNHDNEVAMTTREQQAVYESFPLCLSQAGDEDIHGVGNYVLNVYSSKDESVAYNLFALDSNREMSDLMELFGVQGKDNNVILPFPMGMGKGQATVLFNQIMWYYNTSLKLEKEKGAKIPAVMFMHVPTLEFGLIHRNPEECDMIGHKRESVGCSELNSGLFFACLERGDVKGIFCGHEHHNTYQGQYCGITLAYDGCVGYDMSAHDDLRGGRVIDLDEQTGKFETRFISLQSLLGQKAWRREDWFEGGDHTEYFIRNTHL